MVTQACCGQGAGGSTDSFEAASSVEQRACTVQISGQSDRCAHRSLLGQASAVGRDQREICDDGSEVGTRAPVPNSYAFQLNQTNMDECNDARLNDCQVGCDGTWPQQCHVRTIVRAQSKARPYTKKKKSRV